MKHLLVTWLLTIGLVSCSQQSNDIFNVFEHVDSRPPVLISITTHTSQAIELCFDEPIDYDSISLRCKENIISNHMVHDDTLTISLLKPIPLARAQSIEGSVRDLRGNSTYISILAWANNEQVPTLLINEFTTKGSENNPDRVELIALSRGNIAGVTLYAGTSDSWTDRIILPELWVERGTYIVISFSESSTVDEKVLFTESLAGLGANNGCLTLAKSPHWDSVLLDAVVWGNHTTTTHEGFGSQQLKEAVETLYQNGHWKSSSSSESVDSTNSTATRSFCRDNFYDTNSSTDWYICTTREASFGSLNSTLKYNE